MKKFLIIFFFILFQSPFTLADDIKDLQIEGLSVGDSLLAYFSEEKIINSKVNYGYPDDKFYAVSFYGENFYETYESLEIHLKTGDKKYKIYGLDGLIFYDKIKDCYKKKDEIEKDFSEIFNNTEKSNLGSKKLKGDKSGRSTIRQISWKFDSGDMMGLECYDWSDEIKKTKNWYDNLRVSIVIKELNDWLLNLSY